MTTRSSEDLQREMDALVSSEYPVIPLYHHQGQLLMKPYVQGLTPRRLMGFTPWESLGVKAD